MNFKKMLVVVALAIGFALVFNVGKITDKTIEYEHRIWNFTKQPEKMEIPPQKELGIKILSDIPYIADNDPKHCLDLYIPQEKNSPVVIFVHGGSWSEGDKSIYGHVGRWFANNNITAAIVNYRLTPKVKHPEHTEDVAAAVAWVHDNIKKYNANPEKLYLAGHSSGGFIVAALSTDEHYLVRHGLSHKNISGTVCISGIYSVGTMNSRFGGFSAAFSGVNKAAASPINHVHKGCPRFFILFGQKDYTTAGSQAKKFHTALIKAGNDAQLMEVPKLNHYDMVITVVTPDSAHGPKILEFIKK